MDKAVYKKYKYISRKHIVKMQINVVEYMFIN